VAVAATCAGLLLLQAAVMRVQCGAQRWQQPLGSGSEDISVKTAVGSTFSCANHFPVQIIDSHRNPLLPPFSLTEGRKSGCPKCTGHSLKKS
jgi:hypothetical protein